MCSKKRIGDPESYMVGFESNKGEKQEVAVGTPENPLKVEVMDHMRIRELGAQSIFITTHAVPELYSIARERRNASIILIDDGVRYSLRSVQIPRIETDGGGRMTCHYVDVSPPPPSSSSSSSP